MKRDYFDFSEDTEQQVKEENPEPRQQNRPVMVDETYDLKRSIDHSFMILGSALNFGTESARVSPVLKEKRRFPIYKNSWYDYFVLILLTIVRTCI